MKRAILAFLAGLVAWSLVISLLDRAMRGMLDGYAAAEPTMTFTLGMMAARLTMAAITSLLAGTVTRWVAPASNRVAAVLGAFILLAFIPIHVWVWNHFPIWYHLTFLLTIVPLVVLGSWLAARAHGAKPPVWANT